MSAALITTETELAMAAWALAQVDTPWVHQGRVPGKGLDCLGLAVCAARAQGLHVRDDLTYSETPSFSRFLDVVRASCEPTDADRPGRMLVFSIRRYLHLGLSLGDGSFVHAIRRRDGGEVIVSWLSGMWGARLHSIWRYK